jgi:endoglucanase
MKKGKFIGLVTSISILMSFTATYPLTVSAKSGDTGEMRNISTMELVRDMGIGINLGNTFDACGDWIAQWSSGSVTDYETAWGSPVVTQDMIQGYADEGFGVVRIPVAWSNMMNDDGTYTINSEWMARITEVVDWVLDADMYAIINIHWDNGWVNDFPENKDESMKRYETMWTQISDNFKDYSDYLMFESQNEELGWESIWNKWAGDDGKEESYQLVNEINQKFVDTVRNSGGNNAERHLLISGYNTGIDVTCDSLFKMPDDPVNRCAVSVHYYTPVGFAILEEDASWASARSTWGTDEDYAELNSNLDMLKTNFIDKGIPVIIGEYGCPIKNKDADSVRLFLSSVCRAAYERNLCPILWDTPGGHYNRETYQLNDRQLKQEYDDIVGRKQDSTTDGDINMDGSVNISDIVMLKEYLLSVSSLTEEQAQYADICKDGVIDCFDFAALRKMLVK